MSDGQTIRARFRCTYHIRQLADLAQRESRPKRWLQAAAAIIGPLAVIVGAAAWEGNIHAAAMVLGIVLFVGMIAFSLIFLILPFLPSLQFDENPGANPEEEWSFSDEMIVLSNQQGILHRHWTDFLSFTVTRYGILLLPHAGNSHFIPNDAFETPEHIGALKAMASANSPVYKELK